MSAVQRIVDDTKIGCTFQSSTFTMQYCRWGGNIYHCTQCTSSEISRWKNFENRL